jgi:hypothetical protein
VLLTPLEGALSAASLGELSVKQGFCTDSLKRHIPSQRSCTILSLVDRHSIPRPAVIKDDNPTCQSYSIRSTNVRCMAHRFVLLAAVRDRTVLLISLTGTAVTCGRDESPGRDERPNYFLRLHPAPE